MSYNCSRLNADGSSCYGGLNDCGDCYPCNTNIGVGEECNGTNNIIANPPTLNGSYTKNYSVLGGVVASKRSAYTIMGMRNPNLEKPVKKLDTSLPSLRQTGATSNFNNFNPYGNAPRKSSEIVRNTMSMKVRHNPVLTTVIDTFAGGHSPVLPKKYINQH